MATAAICDSEVIDERVYLADSCVRVARRHRDRLDVRPSHLVVS